MTDTRKASPNTRPGLADVARASGVSLSTVDRVLNERGSVSERKRLKVLEAARSLGMRRILPSAVHGLLRVDLLMVDSQSPYFYRLKNAFAEQMRMHRSRLLLQQHIWEERNPGQLVQLIEQPRTRRQGLIVLAQDTPEVRKALAKQISLGVPVVLLTTNLSGLSGAIYTGVDNHVLGRAAGSLMAQWLQGLSGDLLLVTNSFLYLAHRERIAGFLEVMQQKAPKVDVCGPFECYDDDEQVYRAISDYIAKGRKMAGLYTTGSGGRGVEIALHKHGIKPVWIGHEANDLHHRLMRDGLLSLVLDQDPEGQAEAAIQHVLYANGDLDAPPQVSAQLRMIIDETLGCWP